MNQDILFDAEALARLNEWLDLPVKTFRRRFSLDAELKGKGLDEVVEERIAELLAVPDAGYQHEYLTHNLTEQPGRNGKVRYDLVAAGIVSPTEENQYVLRHKAGIITVETAWGTRFRPDEFSTPGNDPYNLLLQVIRKGRKGTTIRELALEYHPENGAKAITGTSNTTVSSWIQAVNRHWKKAYDHLGFTRVIFIEKDHFYVQGHHRVYAQVPGFRRTI